MRRSPFAMMLCAVVGPGCYAGESADDADPSALDAASETDTPDTTPETVADTPDTTDTVADTTDTVADTTDTVADTTDTASETTPDTTEDTTATPSDDIFGTQIPRATSWWVNTEIHRGPLTVRLRGLNWFGLETPDHALHGTWTGRKVETFLAEIRAAGFDSLRIPVSPESINPGFASASWAASAYESGPATTGREHLDRLLTAAQSAGLTVLLDFHSCSPYQIGGSLPGRPDGCTNYDEAHWLADLKTLATLAEGQDHIAGIDLTNEPHALTWAAWKAYAEHGAEAVLRQNPRLLIFVEGVGNQSDSGGNATFWGENLTEAAANPPSIPASRLVFSPHVYGPSVAGQGYFGAASFPANMPAIWTTHFGHLAAAHPVVVGEFGGKYDYTAETQWNDAFVAYLTTLDHGRPASFYYWALNPNSGDTGGLYADDWTTLVPRRLTLLAPLLGP